MSTEVFNLEQQYLEHLEMSWDDAVARRDVNSIADLITDDYEATDINGQILDKSAILQAVAASNPKLKPYRRDDVKVRIEGDTAVITGLITWGNGNGNGANGNENGHSHAHTRAEYLKLYVKRDDGWKALAARATRINGR